MSLLDDRSPTTSDTSDVSPRSEVSAHTNQPTLGPGSSPSPPVWTWLMILAAGLLGGLAGFGIGEVAPRFVRPSFELSPEIRRNGSAVPIEIERRMAVSRDSTASLAFGGLGMVLGLGLGVVGGLARRAPFAAIAAGLTGLILGGAAGAGSTIVLVRDYRAARAAASEEDHNNDLAVALRTHGGIWITIGAAAGLALGIGLGGWSRLARSVIGGILGALVAAVIYEFGGAILFPLGETFRPTAAELTPRLFAHLTVAFCIAAGAFLFANHLTFGRSSPKPAH